MTNGNAAVHGTTDKLDLSVHHYQREKHLNQELAASLEETTDLCLVLKAEPPTFTVVGVSRAYLKAAFAKAHDLIDRPLADVLADAHVPNRRIQERELMKTLETVIQTQTTGVLAPRKYRLTESLGSITLERWWGARATPIHNHPGGAVTHLLLHLDNLAGAVPMEGDRATWLAEDAEELLQTVRTIARQAHLLEQAALASARTTAERRYVAHIQHATVLLSERVDSLLAVLRVAIGEATLVRRPVDLCVVARNAINRTPALAGRTHLRATNGLHAATWGDERLILQAITHLLNHVVKHSQGTSPIAVHISRSDEARLRITIEDHGPTAKALELATDFVSTSSAPRPRRQGYLNRALEPYLSKVIVEAHDGHIWADCTAAGSARWNLTFPLANRQPVTARYTPATSVGA